MGTIGLLFTHDVLNTYVIPHVITVFDHRIKPFDITARPFTRTVQTSQALHDRLHVTM